MSRGNRKEKFCDEPMTKTVKAEVEKVIRDTSPAEMETPVPPTVRNGEIVNTLQVRVRKEPSFESEVVEVLRKGDKVKILKREGDFWKVSTSMNKIAYISSEFIKED